MADDQIAGGLQGPEILPRDDGSSIAYHRVEGKSPGVVFLHGFHSDMTGGKALALEAYCRDKGYAFLRFDTFGHGQSSGEFSNGTISRWAEDAVAVIDALTEGAQVLVGSSCGGWIALLAALQRRDRVAGIVGVAPAPDFTEKLMWTLFTEEQRRELIQKGEIFIESDYEPGSKWRLARTLIEDGRNNLLLGDTINLYCPVRLIHGQRDEDVPWNTSLELADRLAAEDVEILLIKDGGHRLSRSEDLARIVETTAKLLEKLENDTFVPPAP